ncbi:MAG: hypothetical protein BWK75_03410 [Candidatus Altiarchaeales archaeon A3]|nr:MAG: hypothetical protein BWK75_03410 [Candidatus Altiarchaeales archaeon A3]
MEICIKFRIEEETELIAAHKIWAGEGGKSMNKFVKFAILEKAKEIQLAEFEELKKYLKK